MKPAMFAKFEHELSRSSLLGIAIRASLILCFVSSGLAVAQDATPPTAPTGLTATPISDRKIGVSWNAATDNVAVTGYRVYRCEGAGCTNFVPFTDPGASQTTVNNSGLQAATSYSYKVQAKDAQNNWSDFSNVGSTTTFPSDTSAPTAPTGLIATSFNATTIRVSWAAATDNYEVTGYRIERCEGASCSNFVQVATTATAGLLGITGLTQGTSYSFRVRAADGAGNLSEYSTVATGVTGIPPTAPTGLTATATSQTGIALTWGAATDDVAVTGYRLWRCQGASCTNFVEVGQFNGSQTSTGNSSLQPGTTYSYKVRAADAQLNFSDFSNVATATTLDTTAPTAPTGLTATAVSGSQINLSWAASTDNVGVTGYRVERCQGAACSLFVEVATPAQTSYSSTSLAPASSYTFRVRAIDGAGNLSAFSAAATATTFTVQTQLYFIHADHLNTPRLVADAAGTTVWKWDQQEPFGVNVPDENPSGLGAFEFPVRFPGQYFDKETNLSYNYYRDYDPALGRYTRSDPTGLKGGLNSYSYSGNNPVSFIDPAGLFKCWWVGFVLHCQFGPPPPGPLDWPSDKSGGSSNSNSSEDEKGNDAQCEREDYCSKILQREEALCVSIAGPRYPGNPGQAITICQKAAFQRYIKCKQGLPEHEWPPLTGVDTPI